MVNNYEQSFNLTAAAHIYIYSFYEITPLTTYLIWHIVMHLRRNHDFTITDFKHADTGVVIR